MDIGCIVSQSGRAAVMQPGCQSQATPYCRRRVPRPIRVQLPDEVEPTEPEADLDPSSKVW